MKGHGREALLGLMRLEADSIGVSQTACILPTLVFDPNHSTSACKLQSLLTSVVTQSPLHQLRHSLCRAPAEAPQWKWWPGHLYFTESCEGQSWNHPGSRAVIPGAAVRLQQQAAVRAVQLPRDVYGAIKATSDGMGTIQLALG